MFGASSHESVVCGEMRSSSQHITCLCDLTMDLLISCLVMSLEHSLEKDLKKNNTKKQHTHIPLQLFTGFLLVFTLVLHLVAIYSP